MKKSLFLMVLFTILFFKLPILNATCNKDVIEGIKSNIVTDFNSVNTDDPYFLITVLNFSDDFYLTVKDDYSNTIKTFTNANASNGELLIEYRYIYSSVNYELNFYSNMSDCKDLLIKTVKYTSPKYNLYFDYDICSENKDYEYCEPFANTDNITVKELEKGINEYKKELSMTTTDKILRFIKNNYYFVLIPILGIGGVFTYLIIKTKRSKKE